MGSMHKLRINFFTADQFVTTRTVQETDFYLPMFTSCGFALSIAHCACKKIRQYIDKRMEIDCNLLKQKLRDAMLKEMMQTRKYDNLPGDIKFLFALNLDGADKYNVNCKVTKENQTLDFDVIYFSVGIDYKNYYSNFARPLLINPTERVKRNYNCILRIERIILFFLRDGVELSTVYENVVQFIERENEYLVKHLDKNFGFALNPILRGDMIINAKSKAIARAGMSFSVNVNLFGLEENERRYDLRNSNTVLVRRNAEAEISTFFQSTYNALVDVASYNGPQISN